MTTYTVTYTSSNGQPHQEYGGPYTSRKAAIAAARECARGCLLKRSGGCVHVYPSAGDAETDMSNAWIWEWQEHFEGGFGHQVWHNHSSAVRL